MTDIIMLPGLGGSGESHWQTLWERQDPSMRRFQPSSWDKPILTDWIAALEREISRSQTPPILIAHSLACQLIAHWAPMRKAAILGALLVAAPDPTGEVYLAEAGSFANPPPKRLPFPSLLVASTDDPFCALDHARHGAEIWGSAFADVGPRGHINAASRLGDWPEGKAIFERFRAQLG
ncbi:serine hydrolase family protein [Rhizobium sp. P40RR-XXII]|uniref:RBBP9/YdeN family alpha/beta hydrolase n=1 Tax=Rhizobium sp. P40RR-XXII TaxID=2726739 RepID=UPI0014570632|nr:alpha/beta hydrolase [Rhizobium sp. P40RR-XXII]NLS20580.1 serine hydrolase family protein [Rhizobium sp. P40RR-XXII]